jgi:hypothetical protein
MALNTINHSNLCFFNDTINLFQITKSQFFATEINMMTDTLTQMNELLSPGSPLSGRGLYMQKQPALLVIEDLAPLGFRMADRINGLNVDHCLLAIRGLGRFHASSVALCEKV